MWKLLNWKVFPSLTRLITTTATVIVTPVLEDQQDVTENIDKVEEEDNCVPDIVTISTTFTFGNQLSIIKDESAIDSKTSPKDDGVHEVATSKDRSNQQAQRCSSQNS